MNVPRFLSLSVDRVTPTMHKIRRACFFAAIESAMNGGVLSVTGITVTEQFTFIDLFAMV